MDKPLRLVIMSSFFAIATFVSVATAQPLSSLKTSLATTSSDRASIATLGKDKVTLVVFWLTSCGPSKRQLEALQPLSEEFEGNVEFIAVSIDNAKSMAGVAPYVSSKGYSMTVLLDPGHELFELANGTGHPYTLIYDNDGSLAWTQEGFQEGDEVQMKEEVMKLLADAGATQ